MGQEVQVEKYWKVNRPHWVGTTYTNKMIPMLTIVFTNKSGRTIKAHLPTNAFKGFKVSDWNKDNKFKKIGAKWGHRDLTMSISGNYIKAGCTRVTKEQALETLKVLTKSLGYKMTKRRS